MLLIGGATLATALFAGAAVYITFVEHPARMVCTTEIAVAQWRPSYKRATVMQAPLAVVGALLAVAGWFGGAELVWLAAGIILGAVVPFTLVIMWPTNKELEDAALDMASERARTLLRKWGYLHVVRSGLGAVALLLMVFARSCA